jgi:RNA polymerase sigma factor (sigma-70 family)
MVEDSDLSKRRKRFEALALPHLDAAFNLARWLARDSQDANDVVQEAFLRAFDSFDGMRGDNARPWLLAIVRNTCFTWLARNRPGGGQVSYDEETHGLVDPDANPELLALRADDRRRVDMAIENLPLEFREVVVLRELEDMSYKEIATVLAIPVGTVMSRLARGRHLLAADLTADGNGS